MEERREYPRYNRDLDEVNAIREVARQLGAIIREPVKRFYRIEFSIGEIKYSIISQQKIRLPRMALFAIINHFDSKRGIEDRVE